MYKAVNWYLRECDSRLVKRFSISIKDADIYYCFLTLSHLNHITDNSFVYYFNLKDKDVEVREVRTHIRLLTSWDCIAPPTIYSAADFSNHSSGVVVALNKLVKKPFYKKHRNNLSSDEQCQETHICGSTSLYCKTKEDVVNWNLWNKMCALIIYF